MSDNRAKASAAFWRMMLAGSRCPRLDGSGTLMVSIAVRPTATSDVIATIQAMFSSELLGTGLFAVAFQAAIKTSPTRRGRIRKSRWHLSSPYRGGLSLTRQPASDGS